MKQQIITTVIACLLFVNIYSITDTIIPKTKITNVTVFFSGAQVKRSAEIKLSKGKSFILLDRLPRDINEKSIQVQSIKNCRILSVKHYIKEDNLSKKTPAEKEIEDKIKAQTLRSKELSNKLAVYEIEEKLLIDNSQLSKKTGSTIAQIKEAADYYRLKFNEIRQGKLSIMLESEKIVEKNKELYSELNAIVSKRRSAYAQIFVGIDCEVNQSTMLTFNYYLASAAWSPLYDFRVDELDKPMDIVYNANVYQSTGEDWENVKLKLSTNNPSLTSNKPELNTWYLGNSKTYNYSPENNQAIGAIKVNVKDASTKEPLAFGTVIALDKDQKQVGSGQTYTDGNVIIKPLNAGKYAVKVLYVGFNPRQINGVIVKPDKTTYLNIDLMGGTELGAIETVNYAEPLIDPDFKSGGTVTREEYHNLATKDISSAVTTSSGVYQYEDINVRGGRAAGTNYFVDGERITGNYNIPQQGVEQVSPILGGTPASNGDETGGLNNYSYYNNSYSTKIKSKSYNPFTLKKDYSEINPNLEYSIDIPYTILSDGKDNLIKIKDTEVPATYTYYATPKLDKDVFIKSDIIDWQKLDLISGTSSIYLQGTFTGESEIDANNVSDTLAVSLGRDKNVLVYRERNRLIKDRRIAGNNIKETIAWDITIKNNNTNKIRLILEDQYPVSERSSVEVELLDGAGAKVNPKTGKLIWELYLEPNQKKAISYKYSVKYPKHVEVNLD
jgi:hypothetical protein